LLQSLNPNTNALVRACAGSGKTWLLVARIIRILLSDPGIEPSAILAITFTRKAAAEIESRVLERTRDFDRAQNDQQLDELLAEIGIETPDAQLRARARRLYQLCLLARPPLAVSTFHSWYGHLQRGFSWLAPTSTSGSRIGEGDELLLAAFGRLLDSGRCQQQLSRLVALVSVDPLIEMLRTGSENQLAFAAAYGKAGFADAEAIERCRSDFADSLIAGADLAQLEADEHFQAQVAKLAAFFEPANTVGSRKLVAAAASGDLDELREALYTKSGGKRQNLAKLAASRENGAIYDQVCAAIDQAIQIEAEKAAAIFNADALDVMHEYCALYEQIKREESVADFNDLEFEVWQHLGADPNVVTLLAERIDSQYRHILIDEFQDTSMPQWQIIRSWLDSCVSTDRPPGVFIVGDPKQSIFGWRGARPEVMEAAEKFLRSRYRLESFAADTTRRCPAALIEVVNESFDPQRSQESDGRSMEFPKLSGFSRHNCIDPHRSGALVVMPLRDVDQKPEPDWPQPTLRNSLLEAPPESNLAAARAAIEATDLAALIDDALGSWLIDDPSGRPRPCRAEDVMILARSRNHLEIIARALLGRGIACALPAARLQVATLEGSDIIAILNAVCNRSDSFYLLQALRSPVFGCSEQELIEVHIAGGGELGQSSNIWRGLCVAAKNGSDALRRAQRLLGRWQRLYLDGRRPAHEMIACIYHEGEVIERYVESVPKEIAAPCVRNLEWLLAYALDRRAENVGLYGYVRQLMKMRALQLADPGAADQPDAVVPNAARLLTVHAAKGLEAPVVAVAGAHFQTRHSGASALVGWPAAADRPEHFSFARGPAALTEGQEKHWQHNLESTKREEQNLLYVAMTRASQVLIVSAPVRQAGSGIDWHAHIEESVRFLGAKPDDQKRLVHGKIRLAVADDPGWPAPAQPPAALPQPAATIRTRGQRLAAQTRAAWRGEKLHNLITLQLAGVDDERQLRLALAVDRTTFAQLDQDARRMIGCARFVELRKSASAIELELPAVGRDGKTLLRIDCLLESDEQVWVIDFKSADDASAADFRDQLIGYRDALIAGGESRPIGMAVISGRGEFSELTEPADSD
ncbi:MAG: UvrD-helicase domain-containing protein, partial [Betaproteobacteria bacterium]|nr:UvrD-helicase domain-containing protein [Betaproteobacteria bacterium]